MNHSMHNHDHSHHNMPSMPTHDHSSGMNSPVPKAEHDHGGSAGSNSTDSSMHMMMSMFFHGGSSETILFEFWKTEEIGGLLGSCAFIFFLAIAYEALKFYREHLYRQSFRAVQYNTVTVPVENGAVRETHKTVQVKMMSLLHTWQTALHVIQTIISYFLMLIFMTYNVWLCLAVAAGAGVGYFFFGWKKSLVVDITEHCH